MDKETEPLTGSSILLEPEAKEEVKAPDNGFPIGYGPNEGMKRKEAPKKPSFHERMKRSIQKLSKKQKIRIAVVSILIVLLGGGGAVFVMVSGVFRTDYSSAYSAARELRMEMQTLRSDASCSKVADYINNAYTSEQVYKAYVASCKEVGAGVANEIVSALGATDGVRKDDNIRRKYDTFKMAMDAAREGNAKVNDTLDLYVVWHKWMILESKGDNEHNSWNWSEDDIDEAVGVLLESGNADFVKYGEEWAKYKKRAANATYVYFNPIDPANGGLEIIKEEMEKAQQDFTEWKKKNELKITKVLPLDMVDMAKLYDKFSALYDAIRAAYQENYNYEVGGCKELVNQVICD